MIKLLGVVFLVWSAFALASEDDNSAATCAGYLAVLQKSEGSINTALGMADNPRRALGLAKEWIRRDYVPRIAPPGLWLPVQYSSCSNAI